MRALNASWLCSKWEGTGLVKDEYRAHTPFGKSRCFYDGNGNSTRLNRPRILACPGPVFVLDAECMRNMDRHKRGVHKDRFPYQVAYKLMHSSVSTRVCAGACITFCLVEMVYSDGYVVLGWSAVWRVSSTADVLSVFDNQKTSATTVSRSVPAIPPPWPIHSFLYILAHSTQ